MSTMCEQHLVKKMFINILKCTIIYEIIFKQEDGKENLKKKLFL